MQNNRKLFCNKQIHLFLLLYFDLSHFPSQYTVGHSPILPIMLKTCSLKVLTQKFINNITLFYYYAENVVRHYRTNYYSRNLMLRYTLTENKQRKNFLKIRRDVITFTPALQSGGSIYDCSSTRTLKLFLSHLFSCIVLVKVQGNKSPEGKYINVQTYVFFPPPRTLKKCQ